jgi:hypothetical protein
MSIVGFDYDDAYDLQRVLDSLCECGHKLSYHGFVSGYGEYIGSHLRVSQCCFCTCREFKQAKIGECK